MLRRQAYIENRRVLADSGEIVTDINIKDPISALWLEFRATNGATDNVAAIVPDVVDLVELIDGGKVIFSLTGHQLFSYSAFRLGYIPYNLISELGGNVQSLFACIPFGRWLGDQQMAFDPSRFSNPQLKLKWNLANIRAVGATGFLSGSATWTIFGDIMEGAPQPVGYISAKQHYQFSTAASGTEYIDLPNDYPLKGLMIRSYKATAGGLAGVSNIKLNCDQGKAVPFDISKTDWQRLSTLYAPEFHYKHVFHAKNGDTLYPLLKQDESIALHPESGDNVIGYVDYGIGEGALSLLVGGAAQTNKTNLYGHVHGFLPLACAYMPMGEYDDPNTWLDISAYNSRKLELTQNSASAACSVVIEQGVNY